MRFMPDQVVKNQAPRNSWIQFQHHRMPNLDWTGIYPLPSIESQALSLPLVTPRDPRTK